MTITLTELGLFAAAMFLLVASPGPFVAALAARTVAFGPRSGTFMALGASLTEAVWVLAALLGLGAIAAAHGWALGVLKYAGAAWLVWIGLGLLIGRGSLAKPGSTGSETAGAKRDPLWRAFTAGVLLNLGNPKAALFYMAVFPGFFDMTALTVTDGLVILAVATPIGLGSDLSYVWTAKHARRFAPGGASARRLDRISGGFLAGAGVAIAAA